MLHPEQVNALTNWTSAIKTNVSMKITIYRQLSNIITLILLSLNIRLIPYCNFRVVAQDNYKLFNFPRFSHKYSFQLSRLINEFTAYQVIRGF